MLLEAFIAEACHGCDWCAAIWEDESSCGVHNMILPALL